MLKRKYYTDHFDTLKRYLQTHEVIHGRPDFTHVTIPSLSVNGLVTNDSKVIVT